jgi:DNA-directed RNA polymerase specialized sigma24 family protein
MVLRRRAEAARDARHGGERLRQFLAERHVEERSIVAEERFDLKALRDCLQTLTGRVARIVRHKYMQGLAAVEIAERVRMDAAAVRMALSRARQLLRGCVEKRLAMGGGS